MALMAPHFEKNFRNMTFYRSALFCSLLVALFVSGQRNTSSLFIEFEALERSVSTNFGAEKISVVNALAGTLLALKNESVEEKLFGVNSFFDEHIEYANDSDIFNEKDYWATPSELLGHSKGDCEDFAIAKYVALLHLGVASEKLRLIYVKARIGRSRITQAHMVLGYYDMPSSDPLVLDSLVSNVLPGSQRTDLIPVFSFNDSGIWQPGQVNQTSNSISRLSKWRNVIERMKQEGISRRS